MCIKLMLILAKKDDLPPYTHCFLHSLFIQRQCGFSMISNISSFYSIISQLIKSGVTVLDKVSLLLPCYSDANFNWVRKKRIQFFFQWSLTSKKCKFTLMICYPKEALLINRRTKKGLTVSRGKSIPKILYPQRKSFCSMKHPQKYENRIVRKKLSSIRFEK